MKVKVNVDKDGIVWLCLNRPEKRNAIDYDVMGILEKTIKEIKADDEKKALVITGEGGKAFCSGGDLSVFHQIRTEEDAYKMLSRMSDVLYSLLTIPKPTLALMNGTAIGGGCEMAAACDYRIGVETLKFGFVQAGLGITTGWGGASMLLEKMSYEKALYMLMSGKIFSAEEGLRDGFLHKAVETASLEKAAQEFLAPLIGHDAEVIKAYKQAAVRKWEKSMLRDRIEEEVRRCAWLWSRDEHHQAVDRFLGSKKG